MASGRVNKLTCKVASKMAVKTAMETREAAKIMEREIKEMKEDLWIAKTQLGIRIRRAEARLATMKDKLEGLVLEEPDVQFVSESRKNAERSGAEYMRKHEPMIPDSPASPDGMEDSTSEEMPPLRAVKRKAISSVTSIKAREDCQRRRMDE